MTYRRLDIAKLEIMKLEMTKPEIIKPISGNSCICKFCEKIFYIKKTSSNYSRKVCDECKKV
jgi:hypothetical protein